MNGALSVLSLRTKSNWAEKPSADMMAHFVALLAKFHHKQSQLF